MRHLRGEGVDTRRLRVDPDAPTGLMFRERRILGPAQVVYARAGSAGSRLTAGDVDAATESGVFEGARWLHITGITPALSAGARAATERAIAIARATRAGRQPRPQPAAATVVGRGRGTGPADACRQRGHRPWQPRRAGRPGRYHRRQRRPIEPGRPGPRGPGSRSSIVVAKLGAAGSLAVSRDAAHQPVSATGIAIPIVLDPVGAGDAFCAGFIAERLDGAELAQALATGNACGAATAATLSDQTGLPDRHELAALMDARPDANDTIR